MAEITDSIVGQLPADQGELFVVPACTNFFLKSVVLVNNRANGDEDVELWIERDGNQYRLFAKRRLYRTTADAGKDFDARCYVPLVAGDKVVGRTTTADQVDYMIGYYMRTEE